MGQLQLVFPVYGLQSATGDVIAVTFPTPVGELPAMVLFTDEACAEQFRAQQGLSLDATCIESPKQLERWFQLKRCAQWLAIDPGTRSTGPMFQLEEFLKMLARSEPAIGGERHETLEPESKGDRRLDGFE